MKAGIVGFSQSGKRTLFSLLTGRSVPEERRPDESIEGAATVKDPRVDAIAAICKPKKIKFAETTFVLLPDVSMGSGRREWLEAAKLCDLLCVVVRAFSSESVYHPDGTIDPGRDRGNLEAELLLADLELIEKRLERIGKEKRAGQTSEQILEEKTLLKFQEALESEKWLSTIAIEEHERSAIGSLGLLSLKPISWVMNVDEGDVTQEVDGAVSVACEIEREIMEIDDADERREYLADLGLDSSCVERMNRAVYDAMGLMSFYTMGPDEARAWTIRKGTPAPQAAGKIHSDIERGFIRVEVVKYDDLIETGGETAAKEQGKALLKGKDYVIEDGDICNFRFNV